MFFFSVLKHYLDLYITDTVCSERLLIFFCLGSVSHGVRSCFPGLWGLGISDAILRDLQLPLPLLMSNGCPISLFPLL